MLWPLLVVLLVFSAFFSSAETALLWVSDIKVQGMVRKGLYGAKALHRLKQHPRRFIITLLICNCIVNTWAAAVATVIATATFGSEGVGIATGIMAFILLSFCEIIPKGVAISKAESYSRIIAPSIQALEVILFPIVRGYEWITNLFSRGERRLMTEEEFLSLLETGTKDRVIEQKEQKIIEDILKFSDLRINKVMTPKAKMFSLGASMRVSQALRPIHKERYSRIPITDHGRIVGVILVKDVLTAVARRTDPLLREIARQPLFTSEERTAADLFREMQRKHVHIAIIHDEFGQISGMITLEDLMEQIVGEIADESDEMLEGIRRIDKNTVIALGKTEIQAVNNFFTVSLPAGKYLTVNGFLTHEFRGVPAGGQQLTKPGLRFTVLESTETQVVRVRIERL